MIDPEYLNNDGLKFYQRNKPPPDPLTMSLWEQPCRAIASKFFSTTNECLPHP
jgi:hypothetical protein